MVAPVEIQAGDSLLSAEARNISVAGMLIRSSSTFPEQTVARFSFSLPGTPQKISVGGVILHVSPDAYMGVRFDDVSPADRAAIEQFVNQSAESI